jgi:signal recognition particle subunit SRP14
LEATQPLSLLIRATNGKHKSKAKLSTIVTADSLESFFTRYAEVCKTGMSGLKKRDRSKAKARQKAKKKAAPVGEEKK